MKTPVKILIIDDEAAVRDTLADLLELNGFSVVAGANGVEGLALARRDQPALILTDVHMPQMDGFQFLAALRTDETLRRIPVIVLSAAADRASSRRGMDLGAGDYISKPFTEQEVLHSIAARLEKKELLDELDGFAHTVAHDLKNPLATLSGRIELAQMLMGEGDAETVRRHLDQALRSADRLTEIINELLVLAGVRRQTVAMQPIDMAAAVAEAMDRLDHLLSTSQASVSCPERWPVALGHAPWITHVWANYLSNAAKYGGEHPQIELGAEAGRDGVRFWVQDQGPGLDREAIAQLFVPFSQIPTARVSGHGLGLSIVRRIIDKLDGRVGVDSTPGHGARFWFELPALGSSPAFRKEPA